MKGELSLKDVGSQPIWLLNKIVEQLANIVSVLERIRDEIETIRNCSHIHTF